jgi:hypothetical protein
MKWFGEIKIQRPRRQSNRAGVVVRVIKMFQMDCIRPPDITLDAIEMAVEQNAIEDFGHCICGVHCATKFEVLHEASLDPFLRRGILDIQMVGTSVRSGGCGCGWR